MLSAILAGNPNRSATTVAGPSSEARETGAQLASILFYEPALAELRKSPFGQEFGTGGRGEEVFGEQLDKQMALAVARRDQGGLAKSIAGKLDSQIGANSVAANSGGTSWLNLLKVQGLK